MRSSMLASAPLSVGLDYHKDSVQVCILKADGSVLRNGKVASTAAAVLREVRLFGPSARVALESCSGAATLADELLAQTSWDVQLAHPGYVSRMRQNPDKSDYSDARMLAELLRAGFLPGVWLPPAEIRDLRQLMRYRQQLVNARRDAKLRVRALLREWRVAAPKRLWNKLGLLWLQTVELPPHSRWVLNQQLEHVALQTQKVREVEKVIRQALADDPTVSRLRREPGIGWITAGLLRAEIGWFSRFRSGKQLARYCGLSPRNASSGERQAEAGLVKGCNRQLRAALMEMAHRLMRYDPRWKSFKEAMRQRGKPIGVITAAVANRVVRKLYYTMQTPSGAAPALNIVPAA